MAARESLYLAGVPAKGEAVEHKARIVANISQVVERDAVLFVEIHTRRQSIEGTPLIQRAELRKIRAPEEIEDLIDERGK